MSEEYALNAQGLTKSYGDVRAYVALMHRPKLLLMDEPTGGLDPLMQQEVYRLLKEAQASGATVFFSSHIISEVEALAERVAIIRQGVIIEGAEPKQLIRLALRRVQVRFQRRDIRVGREGSWHFTLPRKKAEGKNLINHA
jgi:ABC-2 type transport system ATP-binding protein